MSRTNFIFIALLLCFFFFAGGVCADPEIEPELQKEDLAVGYIRGQFYRINRLDAEAAFKTLSRTLGINHGYEVDVTVKSFEDGEEVEAYLQHSVLHLIIYNSLDYLKTADESTLEPLFVSTEGGQVMRRYVLLTRGPELNSLAALKNKSLNIYYGPRNSLAVRWIEALLKNRYAANMDSFFGSVKDHSDPLAAILPVFFGKTDSVLVDLDKFELMVELNPQLKKLRPIVISEPYVAEVLCFSRSNWSSEVFRRDMLRTMARLHETPAGRQILMLFRADKIVPFESRYLESTKRLRKNILNMDSDLDETAVNVGGGLE